jgi:hypothetical protein
MILNGKALYSHLKNWAVIPATWEALVGRSTIWGEPGQKVRDPIRKVKQKNFFFKVGGMVQVVEHRSWV